MNSTALTPGAPLVDAIRAIEASKRRIAVVTDGSGLLLGTLTDGDVRRCLLAGGGLQTPVADAMNTKPLSAPVGSPESHLLDLMRTGNIMAIPLLDSFGRFVRLIHLMDLAPQEASNEAPGFEFAVIMAGGEGMRLRPLTENIPKPMVDIAGVPLLERQIERLAKAGIRRVYLSVNYLSHVIEDYFGAGENNGIEIRYLKEEKKLGTAGALALLPERPTKPIIVMNGDILTTSDFRSLFEFHEAHQPEITIASISYHISIPFGVISAQGPYVREVREKPSQRYMCNAGIYALSPKAIDYVRGREFFNMTDMVDDCLKAGDSVAVFPLHEYWSDIGTPKDLEQARIYFGNRKTQNE